MVELEIYKLKKEYRIDKKLLLEIFKRAAKLLRLKNFSVSLAFVDDRTIKKLNKKYRHKDKVTDVLSFEFRPLIFNADDTDSQKRSIDVAAGGEIVISYPEAKRQAREYKEPLQKTISRLFVHGLLHIVGYRHATKKERKKMLRMEIKILGG